MIDVACAIRNVLVLTGPWCNNQQFVMGLWDSFCGDTTLHGYQYIIYWKVLEKKNWAFLIFQKGRRDGHFGSLSCFSAWGWQCSFYGTTLQSIWAGLLYICMHIFSCFHLSNYFSFTTTSIQSTTSSLDNIFYPSVTVCNMNQIRCDLVTSLYCVWCDSNIVIGTPSGETLG